MTIDSVNDITPRIQYVATAGQTEFDYPFPIFQDADLVVDVDGVPQTLDTDYTVAGEGDDTGGTVTFTSALEGDEVVTIYRQTEISRETDFQQNGPFASDAINDEFDKSRLIEQELRSAVRRCLRLPITANVDDEDIELGPIANWLNKFLYINSQGQPEPVTGVTTTAITQEVVAQALYPVTDDEDDAGLTVINYEYEPFDLFRYMTAEQIADVRSGAALVDVTDVVQTVMDAAGGLLSEVITNPYQPAYVQPVRFRPGRYRISSTLTISDNFGFCNLVGDDGATLHYVGSGTCLHVGNGTSNGIMPVHVRNICFSKDDNASGSVGLKIEHASNGCYEGIATIGFATGVYVKGSINILLDFKRRAIFDATTGILCESSQGSGGGLRFANNILTIKNAMIHGGTVNGIRLVVGSGVSPSGAGGCITIDNCTFEQLDGSGRALYIENAGETLQNEEVVIRSCWFEFYGATLATLANTRARFENCFIANGSTRCFELVDNTSKLTLEACFGYFADGAPSVGHLVDLTGSATSSARKNIVIERCRFQSLSKLHSGWPTSDQGINVQPLFTYKAQYNANYPSGNNNNNHGLALTLIDEINKFVGPDWWYCDVVFAGNDGTANFGRVSLRIYRYSTNVYAVKDIDGNNTAYTLSNTTASNMTITFANDATARWFQMVGFYTPVLNP